MIIEVDKQYRIKEFAIRPSHWSNTGAMDRWQGKVMTIREITEDKYVYCYDSESFYWYTSDFEAITTDWDA